MTSRPDPAPDSNPLDAVTPAWLSVCVAVGPKESHSRLLATLDSAISQSDGRVEIILKALGNHLVDEIREYRNSHANMLMKLHTGPDTGIYDAFNICLASATGQYVLFLGCGDQLADSSVVSHLQRDSKSSGMPDVIYGHVILSGGRRADAETFSTDCFFGRRARFPWRNPCHHQGLLYKTVWLTRNPFRTDIGPLADLVHTYQHRIFERAKWIERPISIFRTDGASYRMDVTSLKARLRGVHANCENFPLASGWKLLASVVYFSRFVLHRLTRKPSN